MIDSDGLDRRELLGAAAAGALLFGFPFASWGDDKKTTEAFKSALAAMKERKQPGVAIVVDGAPKALAEQLTKLFPLRYRDADKEGRAVVRLFLEAVWVCVPRSLVTANAGENAALVDESGQTLASGTLDFSSGAKLVESTLALMDKDGRRAARIKAAREAGAAKLVEGLRSKNDDERSKASVALDTHFVEWACALFEDTKGEDDLARGFVEIHAERTYDYWVSEMPSLPYGVKWDVKMSAVADCPPCGRARPTLEGRTFVEFLTRSE